MKKLLRPFKDTPWYDKVIASIIYLVILSLLLTMLTGIGYAIYINPGKSLASLGVILLIAGFLYLQMKYD